MKKRWIRVFGALGVVAATVLVGLVQPSAEVILEDGGDGEQPGGEGPPPPPPSPQTASSASVHVEAPTWGTSADYVINIERNAAGAPTALAVCAPNGQVLYRMTREEALSGAPTVPTDVMRRADGSARMSLAPADPTSTNYSRQWSMQYQSIHGSTLPVNGTLEWR